MKKTFITSEGQNIYDVALTLYGSIEGVVEVLKDNQHTINSIDSVLTAGTKIIYDTDKVIRKDVQRYLSEKGIIANTGDVPVPVAPSDLVAVQTPNTIGSISLSWSDNSGDEQAFELWRKPQGTGTVYAKVASLPADSTSYEDTELDDGRAYDYQIRAINGIGFSDFSNEATASTLAPVLDFYALDDSLLSITKTGVPEQWKHTNGRSKLFIFDDISTVTGFSSVSRDETTQDVTATAGITGTLNFSQFTHLTTIDAPDQDFDILFGSWVQQPNINVDISNSLISVFPAVKNAINSLITANGGDNTALDESGNYDPSQAGQTHANRTIKIGTVTEPIIFDTTNPEMKLLWEKIMALGTDGIEGVGFFISTVNQLCLKFITFDTGDTFEATTYLEQTTEILETDKIGGDDMVIQLYPTEADAVAKTNLITEGRPYINNHLKTKIWSEGEKMGLRVFAIDTESVSNRMEMTYKAFPTGERACGVEVDVTSIRAVLALSTYKKLQKNYYGNFYQSKIGSNEHGVANVWYDQSEFQTDVYAFNMSDIDKPYFTEKGLYMDGKTSHFNYRGQYRALHNNLEQSNCEKGICLNLVVEISNYVEISNLISVYNSPDVFYRNSIGGVALFLNDGYVSVAHISKYFSHKPENVYVSTNKFELNTKYILQLNVTESGEFNFYVNGQLESVGASVFFIPENKTFTKRLIGQSATIHDQKYYLDNILMFTRYLTNSELNSAKSIISS